MNITVVYAEPGRQWLRKIVLPAGARVRDAIEKSGAVAHNPQIKPDDPVGVYGERRAPDSALEDGDRVEIYRRLPHSPRELRRRRAAAR